MSESEAIATLKKTIEKDLQEIFGSYQVDKDGDYLVRHESSVAFIRALPWIQDQTIVRVWAITNVGVNANGELSQFLASENRKLVFGSFALDPDNHVVLFGHTLLGDFLQRKELETAVAAVVITANEYDDQIKQRFGGRLFTEQ